MSEYVDVGLIVGNRVPSIQILSLRRLSAAKGVTSLRENSALKEPNAALATETSP